MIKHKHVSYLSRALLAVLLMLPLGLLHAQEEQQEQEEILELSPFEVLGSDEEGYRATHTLAGTRIRTQLEDVGSSIQVITADFLQDTAVTDNRDLLQYTTNTEVGGVDGNFGGAGAGVSVNESFANPSNTTRVRGLAAADNTRNFFLSSIPWDGYNVDRVDIQRGPNAILFGFGSPAGIINTGLIKPYFGDDYEVEFRLSDEQSLRGSFDFNKEILEDQIGIRIAGVRDEENYRQDPAFENDERIFAAMKIEPEFLKTDWARSTFNAYYESGNIEANRPRTITAQDRISAWFRPVHTTPGDLSSPFNPLGGIGKGTFTPAQLENNNDMEPNQGQNRKFYAADGSRNPYYIPMIGNFGQVFGGPIAFIPNADDGIVRNAFVSEFRTTDGIGPDGNTDGSVSLPFSRMASVDIFSQFAKDAELPFADFGQYKNVGLDDRSIFDFYENLLDGPNKSEQQDWSNWNVSWQQTFFQDRIGFELVHDHQEYFQTGTALITDSRQAIMIDLNEELTDGTPNPNVGRPFISGSGQFGNFLNDTERDATRFTAFAEHNFEDYGDSWIFRLLGRQNFTGLLSEEESSSWNANWQRHTMGQDYRDYFGVQNITDNANAFNHTVYIGPSLVDRDSASGANLVGAKGAIQIPDSTVVRFWDDTWAPAAGISPADEWITPDGEVSTQSENPANYVGWTTREFSIEKASAANPFPLATGGSMSRDEVSSEALVFQNYFWDGALVGTYGWRRDVASAFSTQAQRDGTTQRAQLRDMMLPADPQAVVEAQTSSWSAVVHLHRLPWLNDRLPLGVSLYYNESENFQPAAGRVDLFGRSIAPPSGNTIDRSILLQTKDGRFSLRATRYTTSVTNASADRIQGDWFIGALQAWGNNWRNIFALDNNNGTFGSPTGENTYAPLPGQTQEEADALEQAAIAGWDAHIQNLRNLSEELTGNPNAFDETYQIDRSITSKNGITATTPNGLSFTQDAISEGWEFEFTARPLENWDITVNAAKVEAVRNNVGGEALLRYVELVNNDLNNTPAGDLRLWWGSAGSPTFLSEWNSVFNSNFNLTKLLEGTSQPEIREWRFNLVTNYRFTDGALKGFNVGAGYRWQDDVIIGFPPEYTDATQTDVTFDLGNPYLGPTEDNLDMWVGYRRDITDDIAWRVQLNVRNVTGDDELIPINVQPDGTVAAWRLGAQTMWSLTNTFNF